MFYSSIELTYRVYKRTSKTPQQYMNEVRNSLRKVTNFEGEGGVSVKDGLIYNMPIDESDELLDGDIVLVQSPKGDACVSIHEFIFNIPCSLSTYQEKIGEILNSVGEIFTEVKFVSTMFADVGPQ